MTIENRIAGALAGMVLGDALGVPGELWPREKVRARFGHIDTFLDGPEDNIVACYFKAGHYTDDSAQAFVILKALLKAGTVPPVKVLADDLIAWVESMNGFEINLLGPSSKASLLAHSRGEDYTKYTKLSLTNGAGMRIAPVGCLVDWNDSEKLAETVARVSIVTHGTDVAIGGAAMVAQAVASGIGGRSWEEAAEDVLRIWNVARAKGEPTWAASVAERFRLALSVMKDFDDDEKFSRWVYDIHDDERERERRACRRLLLPQRRTRRDHVRQHGRRHRHDRCDGLRDLRCLRGIRCAARIALVLPRDDKRARLPRHGDRNRPRPHDLSPLREPLHAKHPLRPPFAQASKARPHHRLGLRRHGDQRSGDAACGRRR